MNAGLTQVLQDGANTYLYGNGRIAQTASTTEYFLGDALGSVRQLADTASAVTLTQSYAPYGKTISSAGSGASIYQFTSEARDANGLTYLRTRYYNSGDGRFISRDTWNGDYNRPLSLNRWNYVEGNPVNLVDPSGYISCESSSDPICVNKIRELKIRGDEIKQTVRIGYVPPVESLAQYVDYAFNLFDNDIRGAMWALTLTLDGMDANRGAIWWQAFSHKETYWLHYDWLPYKNNPTYNDNNWGNTGDTWRHSEIGDWKKQYWDKTANQAYHFWYFVAVTFFDDRAVAYTGNIGHEIIQHPTEVWKDIPSGDNVAPPYHGKTREDWNLSIAGMDLGSKLLKDYYVYNYTNNTNCHPEMYPNLFNHTYTKPGAWIRSNLKD